MELEIWDVIWFSAQWLPIVLCVTIAVLTYSYKLDSIRETMTEELDLRREKRVYEM